MNWAGKQESDNLNFYSLLNIVQCGLWLQDDIDKYLQQHNMSYGRFSILLTILDTEDHQIKGADLVKKIGLTKATISKMIQKLVSESLVKYEISKDDRREKVYTLTSNGNQLLEKVIPDYLKRMRIIGSNISIDEKRYLINILSKLNYLESSPRLSRYEERPLGEKTKEIKELCETGTSEAIDRVMEFVNDDVDIPTTKIVDYYLGTVDKIEGMKRIEYYLFNGTQIQRNYSTLFFVRIDDWILVNKAYKMGLIDYIQAYSK